MDRSLSHYFELLISITEKEFRARYKHTIFGFFWLVANPFLQMLVIGFVFTFFMKEPIDHYYFHLFTGLLVWNFFSLSLTKATPSIVYERSLVKKAKFPLSVIPISIIVSNLIHFLLAFGLLLIPIFFLNTFSITRIGYLFVAFAELISFTIGISLLACALNVRFRDVAFFMQALLVVWFYATPIIYSLSQIPLHLLWLWRINPLTSVLQSFHHTLLGANPPGLFMLGANILVTFIIFFLGIIIFSKESKYFDDWL